MNKKYRKLFFLTTGILFCISMSMGLWIGYHLFIKRMGAERVTYVHLPQKEGYSTLSTFLQDSIGKPIDPLCDWLVQQTGVANQLRGGRYAIEPSDNLWQILRRIRSGSQTPVRITFNNIRTKEELSRAIGSQLELSPSEVLTALRDSSWCQAYGLDTTNIVSIFLPNTYDFYWNVSIKGLFDRMAGYYHRFWNDKRKALLQHCGLSAEEVVTLASIVEEECYFADEYPIVAGLYINRLRKNQLLQADPTVKFALGDFSLRRILYIHTQVNSPYNTYIHPGLPPGPIRIPSIAAIDSVLHFTTHNYLYMCAKEDFSGRHAFASSYSEHQRNARRYQQALNKRGIRG